MNHSEDLQREIENLRERLSRLSQASLRIAGDLDLDAVLQETVDGARALTGARYGVLAVLDDSGQVAALLASGLTAGEFQGLQEIPGGEGIFEYLGSLPEPLRVADFAEHAAALGLPEFLPPVPVLAFLAVPIRHLENGAGHRLVESGRSVLLAPAYRLVQDLLAAKRDPALPRQLRCLDNYDLLLLNDLGYLPQGAEESEVLFTFIAERYERRSLGITSNLVFSQ